jgi:DNA helicase II / ATP-dependent DNA helicase PcrA
MRNRSIRGAGRTIATSSDFRSGTRSARTFKIEVNYRSVPSILALANDAIKGNIRQFAKNLMAVRSGGAKPWLIPCPDSNQQSAIRRPAHPGIARRRRAAQRNRRAVSRALPRHGIADGTDPAQHPVRHHQRTAVFRAGACEGHKLLPESRGQPTRRDGVQAHPEVAAGIGAKIADKLWENFHPLLAEGKPLLLTSEAIPKRAVDDWKKAAQVLNQLRQMEPRRAAEMIEQVVEGFYASYLKVKFPNARSERRICINWPRSRCSLRPSTISSASSRC